MAWGPVTDINSFDSVWILQRQRNEPDLFREWQTHRNGESTIFIEMESASGTWQRPGSLHRIASEKPETEHPSNRQTIFDFCPIETLIHYSVDSLGHLGETRNMVNTKRSEKPEQEEEEVKWEQKPEWRTGTDNTRTSRARDTATWFSIRILHPNGRTHINI